jgi:hypothetical protein
VYLFVRFQPPSLQCCILIYLLFLLHNILQFILCSAVLPHPIHLPLSHPFLPRTVVSILYSPSYHMASYLFLYSPITHSYPALSSVHFIALCFTLSILITEKLSQAGGRNVVLLSRDELLTESDVRFCVVLPLILFKSVQRMDWPLVLISFQFKPHTLQQICYVMFM